jgi:hypothetical protein
MLLLKMPDSSLTLFIVQWQNKVSFELLNFLYVLWILDNFGFIFTHAFLCLCLFIHTIVVTSVGSLFLNSRAFGSIC